MNLDAIIMLCLPFRKQPRISIEKSSFILTVTAVKTKLSI